MKKIVNVVNLNKRFRIRNNRGFIKGIIKPEFRYIDAVKDVSFEVEEGESLAFLGPNGAGKTTTTKMLTGIIYSTSGNVEVLGFKPHERNLNFLTQIGLVMGNKTGLSWDLTACQNFDFISRIYRIPTKKYSRNLGKLIEVFGVEDHMNKQIRSLSLGERMKMELIGAILHNPKVLFLDEPTIGLDIISKKNIRKFLREVQKEYNITLILTSHDMDDVEKVCDRVIVINKGEKVYDDNLSKLVSDYDKKKFIKFFLDKTVPQVINFASVISKDDSSIVYEVSKENSSKLISEVLERQKVIDIDILSVPLEEMIEDIFNKSSGTITRLS